jgi:hypothetical protein
MPERISAKDKQIVIKRAHGCCEYCLSQASYSPTPFSVEHVIPKGVGGNSALENLAFACQGCNNLKYTKTEGIDFVSGIAAPLYHPRIHQWEEHFVWNEDYTQMIGISPIGRATIITMKLNRENVVNLRRALYRVGEHPPKVH